jgi:hypothetical protein
MKVNIADGSISLDLDTRQGNHIENWRDMEISDVRRRNAEGQAWDLMRQLGYGHADTTQRRPPTATYNCHGMTFASRRTTVPEDGDIALILKDDGYREIKRLVDVLPGDIALYYNRQKLVHSGMVATVSRFGETATITVLSKWGSAGEYWHAAEECPYARTRIQYLREARDGTGPVRPDRV